MTAGFCGLRTERAAEHELPTPGAARIFPTA